ncbi:Ig-like domain-containing protein [Streptomyces sp. SD15]
MSKAPANERQLLMGIEASGTFPVEYRFTHAQKGNRHLVVVFANFAAPGDYGWSNGVFDKLRANILWIRDRFDGNRSYYLCKEMDFSLEQSVVTLISKVMKALDLTPDSVTLWGGSKGGSAALYFGLKYGFRNIVSIAPQFLVGTYVRDVHPGVARFMLGESVPEQNVRIVDSLLPDLVRSGVNPTANIYLVSSAQDDQYPVQVEPFLGLFQHYENFNFIFSDSPHITDHTQVAGRNVPVLMGIVNFLIDGIAPRLGFVRNGYEEPDRDRSAITSYLAATAVVRGPEFPPPVVTAPASGSEVRRDAVRITGSARGAVRVSVWEHGKFLGQADVAADGSWSWELGRAWSKGKHPVKVYAVDAAGFQSARTEVLFTAVDSSSGAAVPAGFGTPAMGGAVLSTVGQSAAAPVVLEPVAYEQVMDSRVVFTGAATGAAQVGFRENGALLGGAAVAPNGSWSWDSGWAWGAGMHVVDVFAVDPSGAESPVTQVPFTVMNASAGAPTAAYYGGNY